MSFEVGPEYLRIRLGKLVLFYSLDKHCAGWFVNSTRQCTRDCRIHMLPKYNVVRLWDYDRIICPS